METYTINSAKELEKYKENYGYHIKGNAEFNYSAEFTGRLLVDGYLSIKAGGSIEAGGSIKAGGYIEAGWSIKAGGSIEAGGSIKAGGSIEAGWYIEAGGPIEAGGSIEAGDSYGISAGLSITAKGTISFGLNAYAGIKTWDIAAKEEKTITCSKLLKGNVEYGILKETGEPELDDKTQEAIKVLKEAGYKIVKE